MYLCSQERCQIKEHVENTRLDLHLLASITSPYFIHHWIFRQHPSGVANQRSAWIPDKQRDNLTTPQLLSRSIKSGLLPQSTDDQTCCTVQKVTALFVHAHESSARNSTLTLLFCQSPLTPCHKAENLGQFQPAVSLMRVSRLMYLASLII